VSVITSVSCVRVCVCACMYARKWEGVHVNCVPNTPYPITNIHASTDIHTNALKRCNPPIRMLPLFHPDPADVSIILALAQN
jgi:hypothetical protein